MVSMSKFLIAAGLLLASVFGREEGILRGKVEKAPFPGFRLLATSDDKPPFWVPQDVVEALSSSPLDFMDITDFQDVNIKETPLVENLPSIPSHQSVVNPLLSRIVPSNYEKNLQFFSSYRNRYYTSSYGLESATWLFDTVNAIANSSSLDIKVSKFAHTWSQFSVVARIEGTSSNGEMVIVGAHQDSTAGGMPSGSAPGADDDGSGSMGILEIFRVLVESNFRPQNPIEFHWYSAEEVGLLGSQAIARSYQDQKKVVRSMIQLDMIGYNGKESTVGVVTDYVDADTIQLVRALVDEYLEIGWTNTLCGYGCSDHASWNRYGYRSTFPFEARFSNRSPFIHTSGDTVSTISTEHATEFIKLGLAFAVELSFQ